MIVGGPDINITAEGLIFLASFPIVYHNADSQKKKIYLENKGKSGIYMWVNTINNKKYVGSSADLHRRFSAYYSVAFLVKYDTMLIHRAILKYGYSVFSLHILEYCNKEDLVSREQYYIDRYSPHYNLIDNFSNKTNLKKNYVMPVRTDLKNSSNSSKKVLHTDVNKPRRFYSLSTFSRTLDPQFLTGFVDAEGCFLIDIYRDETCKTGWRVKIFFDINLHKKDQFLLERILNYYDGAGKLYISLNSIRYSVFSEKNIQIIIKHFDKYPLISKKRADYELWKQAFYIMLKKEHLTHEGLTKIVSIKAVLNKGLSDKLKEAFHLPAINSVIRPEIELPKHIFPQWLAGFINGEGCFCILVSKSKFYKTGASVQLQFSITQHHRDIELISLFKDFLKCGNIKIVKKQPCVVFIVTKLSDIQNIIIPLLQSSPLQGAKLQDYLDFVKVMKIMQSKAHLTREGLKKVIKIKNGMNRKREF